LSNCSSSQYRLPERLGNATFLKNIRLRLVYISLGVVSVHLAVLAWLQAVQPEARPSVILKPVQIRQILAQPALVPPPTDATRDQPQRRTKPDQRVRAGRQTSPPVAAPSAAVAITQPDTTALVAPPAESNAPAVESGKPQSLSAAPRDTPVTGQRTSPKGVTLPSSMADYLSNPPPTYPTLSLRLSEQGKVVVRVLIGKNGRALDARIAQSSGFDRLDQAALRAVLNWRYMPGTVDGQPQDMWFDAPINFKTPH